MRKRLNFTERRKIGREQVKITLGDDANGVKTFDVEFKLAQLGLPDSAAVFVEAYYGFQWMRFDFGTVGRIVPPADRRLTSLAGSPRITFRVRVVDTTEAAGRVLAMADRLRPSGAGGDAGREPLLAVDVSEEMEQEIWKVSWSDDAVGPVLQLNGKIADIKALIVNDARYQTLVLPAVLREVLTRMVAQEPEPGADEDDADPDDETWVERWKAFGETFAEWPAGQPEDDALADWVDTVVEKFCADQKLADAFRTALYPQEAAA